jgi:hypothetical protein
VDHPLTVSDEGAVRPLKTCPFVIPGSTRKTEFNVHKAKLYVYNPEEIEKTGYRLSTA